MFDWLTLHVAALVVTAALFGGMTFFMVLFAPLVFRTLPHETATGFMQAFVPTYFTAMGMTALVPAAILAAIASYRLEGIALAAVASMFFATRTALVPALRRSRDAARQRRAASLHRVSVIIHMLQWVIVFTVLVRLAA